jgi:hypothetical protein
MQASRIHLAALTDEAMTSIAMLGDSAAHLRDLARFVAERAN